MKLLLATTTVLLLACIIPAPAQATDVCAGNACVTDSTSGSCQEWGSFGHTDVTGNAAGAGFAVGGWDYCDPWFKASGISAWATAADQGVSVFWWSWEDEFSSGCGTGFSVWNSGEETDVGCPAGAPPNPGWGSVLP